MSLSDFSGLLVNRIFSKFLPESFLWYPGISPKGIQISFCDFPTISCFLDLLWEFFFGISQFFSGTSFQISAIVFLGFSQDLSCHPSDTSLVFFLQKIISVSYSRKYFEKNTGKIPVRTPEETIKDILKGIPRIETEISGRNSGRNSVSNSESILKNLMMITEINPVIPVPSPPERLDICEQAPEGIFQEKS